MSNRAVIISWGRNIAGREHMGLGVFMAAVEHYGKLKATGEIDDFRVYIARSGHVTAQAGQVVIDGSADQIGRLLDSAAHLELMTKAGHVVDTLNVYAADTGDAIPGRIEALQNARKQLGI